MLLCLAGGFEPRRLGCPCKHAQSLPSPGLVQLVDGIHRAIGHIRPGGGLPEGAGTCYRGGNQRDGVSHAFAFFEAAAKRCHMSATVSKDLHRLCAHAHHKLAVVPDRACTVEVVIDADVSTLVGFRLDPSHGIEDSSRKSEHARQVLDESLLGSDACPVPRPAPILSQPFLRASLSSSREVA